MKVLIALLAMLTMLLGTGCSDKKDSDQTDHDISNSENENQDGTVDEQQDPESGGPMDRNDGTIEEDVRKGVDDMGDAVREGADAVGDAVTGKKSANAPDTAGSGGALSPNP